MTTLTQRAAASVCSHFRALTVIMQLSFNPPYKPFGDSFNASKIISTVKTITLGKRVVEKDDFFGKLDLEAQPFINCLYNSIGNSLSLCFLVLNIRTKRQCLVFFSFLLRWMIFSQW